ncbi:MAG: hypothetical protein KKE17_09120 [Proteobacteria bacterium]|nr:hypothetical protein [Pseudomonadota bacterium]MBU1710149.1 hypothetical protein [Pseudomonadota bacterium]
MIANKKEFGGGLLLFIGFWIVFAIGMSPLFAGQNILNYMDNLYNTISKKSAYYIPGVVKEAQQYKGQQVTLNIKAGSPEQAKRYAKLFKAGDARVAVDDVNVKVEGGLGLMLENILNDADMAFANDGQAFAAKYGLEAKQVMYDWWYALKAAEKDFNKQKMFKEAKIINKSQTRGVEPAYNYYGIPAESIKDKAAIVVVSLVGYVIYTLWFGFSILFMFEGWGLKLEH